MNHPQPHISLPGTTDVASATLVLQTVDKYSSPHGFIDLQRNVNGAEFFAPSRGLSDPGNDAQ